jgi:hypothetical protein
VYLLETNFITGFLDDEEIHIIVNGLHDLVVRKNQVRLERPQVL